MTSITDRCFQRRSVLMALPGIVLLPGVVAACSSSDSDTATTSNTPSNSGSGSTGSAGSGAAQGVQVKESDVPVGSAVIAKGEGKSYVVAQPTAGAFVAFSAACTHEGVIVKVQEGTKLLCPAHGSQFDGTTGAATKGPAKSALAAATVTNAGGTLTIT